MKKITLSNGLKCLVDDEDFEWLKEYEWRAHQSHHTIYACRMAYDPVTKGRHQVLMHRVIMNCEKGKTVDHVNQDGLDNRKRNLRIATYSQNNSNRRRTIPTIGGFKGVYPNRDSVIFPWRCRMWRRGKMIGSGAFKTRKEAARQYDRNAVLIHGPFGLYNFLPNPSEVVCR